MEENKQHVISKIVDISDLHSSAFKNSKFLSEILRNLSTLRLMIIVNLFLISIPNVKGTCFKIRLANGKCHHVMDEHTISRRECCLLGGFFSNESLTDEQYIRDILITGVGVKNCQYSCENDSEETCNNIKCDKGYTCSITNSRAVCKCSLECTPEDYENGPVCTTNLLGFRDRCEFMKEQCRNQGTVLVEGNCPPVANICQTDSSNMENLSGLRAPIRRCESPKTCLIRQYSGEAMCVHPYERGSHQLRLAVRNFKVREITMQQNCPEDLSRSSVCGSDNKTYDNMCVLRQQSILSGKEIRIAYLGDCFTEAKCGNIQCQSAEMDCIYHSENDMPICIDCRNLPPNCNPKIFSRLSPQYFSKIQLASLKDKTIQKFGDPRWHGDIYTNGWPHICGSNGQSFLNTCFLHVHNCISRRYIDFSSVGICTK